MNLGTSLPTSGSFLDSSEILEIQIEWMIYHIMCDIVACVPEWRCSVCCASQLSAHAIRRTGYITTHYT
jgi:hypothetical protein